MNNAQIANIFSRVIFFSSLFQRNDPWILLYCNNITKWNLNLLNDILRMIALNIIEKVGFILNIFAYKL